MTNPYRRKRQLRPSFVVTFAAAAPVVAAGCGAVVTPQPCGDGDGGVGSCDGRTPPQPGCPAAEPRAGTACSAPATSYCAYAYYTECPGVPSRAYVCPESTRTWQPQISSCNPPPPMCPPAAPADGASCRPGWGPAPTCNYGDCNGVPTTEARCNYATSQWEVRVTSCNPPPPVCPPSVPMQGAPCPPPGNLTCNYQPLAGCPGAFQYTAICDARTNTWNIGFSTCNPPPPVMCPPSVPVDGEPCTLDPRGSVPSCDYGTCSTTPAPARATCDPTARVWRVVPIACEDGGTPPDDAGEDGGTPGEDGGEPDAG